VAPGITPDASPECAASNGLDCLMTSSIFSAVEMAPRDPIIGLNELFNADTRTIKVNLGVGVYFDDNGKIPLLDAVKVAEKARLEAMPPRGYQPIDGTPPTTSPYRN
jgi:aromatic-amino-acid transaminase